MEIQRVHRPPPPHPGQWQEAARVFSQQGTGVRLAGGTVIFPEQKKDAEGLGNDYHSVAWENP